MAKKTLYTAEATATGGRNGQVRSSDGVIDLQMSAPRGLGGREGATNPEQLFAAGYASCFQQALLVTAGKEKLTLDTTFQVNCEVALQQEGEAYGLAATLAVQVPGLSHDKAEALVKRAHEICPYSVGTRGNMLVKLFLIDDNGHRTEIAQ
jgi:lipoyl-dependent peroxiredoxin